MEKEKIGWSITTLRCSIDTFKPFLSITRWFALAIAPYVEGLFVYEEPDLVITMVWLPPKMKQREKSVKMLRQKKLVKVLKVKVDLHTLKMNHPSRRPMIWIKIQITTHPKIQIQLLKKFACDVDSSNENLVAFTNFGEVPQGHLSDVNEVPNCHAVLGAAHFHPDLILTGHQDNEFSFAMCPTESSVLYGGICSYKGSTIRQGQAVVLRSIQDHVTTVGTYSNSSGSIIKQTGEVGDKSESLSVGPRGVYHGHDDTIEDVAFSPTRTGTSPVMKVEKAHNADPHDDNQTLTGHNVQVFIIG
ncbi:hypothetical protein Bca4012_059010 [Brassica carinata]